MATDHDETHDSDTGNDSTQGNGSTTGSGDTERSDNTQGSDATRADGSTAAHTAAAGAGPAQTASAAGESASPVPSTSAGAGAVATAPRAPIGGPRELSGAHLRWLEEELREWQRDGLVTDSAAETIRGRYVTHARAKLLAVVTGLGVAFVAVGLIWLVAANLDQIDPLVRLGLVGAVWLGLAVVAEVITAERLQEVCRTLAAAAFGAVIFQAAQSLQVPAFESNLVACWGAGALLYAYATGSMGALAVALAACTVWFGWHTGETVRSVPQGAVTVLCAALVATSISLAHRGQLARSRSRFGGAWQIVGAIFALVGLFVATVPFGQPDQPLWQPALGWVLAITAVAVVLGFVMSRQPGAPGEGGTTGPAAGSWSGSAPRGRVRGGIELVVLLATLACGTGLVLWQPSTSTSAFEATAMTPELWARTGASIVLFLAVAAWFAMLGAWREEPELTTLALIALVLFTTFQSFAVFAPIISGATLFLAVGGVMLVSGLAADRVRRLLTRRRGRGSGGPGTAGRSVGAARLGGNGSPGVSGASA